MAMHDCIGLVHSSGQPPSKLGESGGIYIPLGEGCR